VYLAVGSTSALRFSSASSQTTVREKGVRERPAIVGARWGVGFQSLGAAAGWPPVAAMIMETIFEAPDLVELLRVSARLLVAALLGGLLGWERSRAGKAAGLRTHMLVALGAAVFTIAPIEAGMSVSDLSRVFQGIAAGIGFIGAGAILKVASEREIHGLTTAAGIWLTAAVGMAVGAGRVWLPLIAVAIALVVLASVGYVERRFWSPPQGGPSA
jgi:putative Mg2+ transporter-C (MgtC) family protein